MDVKIAVKEGRDGIFVLGTRVILEKENINQELIRYIVNDRRYMNLSCISEFVESITQIKGYNAHLRSDIESVRSFESIHQGNNAVSMIVKVRNDGSTRHCWGEGSTSY